MPKIQVNELNKNSDKVVGAILRSLPEYFTYEPTIDQYCVDSLKPTNKTFVAVAEDGTNVGFALVENINEWTSEIVVMAVRPDWQRRQFGSALLSRVEEYASSSGKKTVILKIVGPSQKDELALTTYDFLIKHEYCLLEEYEYIWKDCIMGLMVKQIAPGQ